MLKRAPKSSGAGTKRGRSEVSLNQSKSKKLNVPVSKEKEEEKKEEKEEEEEEEKGEDDNEKEEEEEEEVITSATSTLDTTAAIESSSSSSSSLQPASFPRIVSYVNKQRVLVFGSRGLTARYRHLMEDIRSLLPHHKKEAKLDAKHDMLSVVNDIAQIKGCGATIFFEVRKRRDLFLWLSKTPSGPSVKFHVVNVHTMDELRLTGNCLRGSRPILSFDAAFDDEKTAPHLRLIRELLTLAFATPLGHPKSQPFHDHVMAFGFADNRIWYRHYQVVDRAADATAAAKMLSQGEQPSVLVEIGPRFVLDIIKIFSKSLGGSTLYSNPRYISPNLLRHELYKQQGSKYMARKAQESEREVRQEDLVIPANPLEDVYKE
jgi:ribosome biogenesis protein BRX1